MKEKKSIFDREIASFRCAFAGIKKLIATESHAKFHAFATVCVVAAGCALRISATEWIAVALAVGLVISAEAFNTCIERLCDKVSPNYDEAIGTIKDIAAGAVLVSAISAAVVGIIVFVPHLVALFL